MIYGIMCIKDTCCMQIWKYVKKTVLELGFMVFMGFNLPSCPPPPPSAPT
jgi:hypothetical protein